MLLRAKYVVPVDGRPIKNGVVRIEHGRIAEVGATHHIQHDSSALDFTHAAILPGFVNAHTHLELTHLAQSVSPREEFFDWLFDLIKSRKTAGDPDRDAADAARDGMKQSIAAGVTTVGDITSRPLAVRAALQHGPLRVISFGEVIATGTLRERLPERLQAAVDATHASNTLTIAVSPHAPYTIEPDAVNACVDSADRHDLRLCMHLAETVDEARYTEHGDGPVREFLQQLGVWDGVISCPRLKPIPLARTCGLLNPRTILAHCNYVSDDDIQIIRVSGAHVAYCPRTHHAFKHQPHRYRDMLAAGINVCLGTDSLASNPSLSILEEMRFLAATAVDPGTSLRADILEMGTVRGARALGLLDVGTLTPAARADLTVIPLDPEGPRDPVDNILTSTRQPVATFIQGRRIPQEPT